MHGQQSTNLDLTKRVSYTLPDLVGYEVSCGIACPQKLHWDKFIIQGNASHDSLLVSYNYWFYADLQACLLRFPGKTSKKLPFWDISPLQSWNRHIQQNFGKVRELVGEIIYMPILSIYSADTKLYNFVQASLAREASNFRFKFMWTVPDPTGFQISFDIQYGYPTTLNYHVCSHSNRLGYWNEL